MPKRQNAPLSPPFIMGRGGTAEWFAIQTEAGGSLRGRGLTEHEIWQVALGAEIQARWKRGRLSEEEFEDLVRYRAVAGLPPLPPLKRAA